VHPPKSGATVGGLLVGRDVVKVAHPFLQVQAYVPTEDTPSQAHYHFLERLKTTILNIPKLTQTLAPAKETTTRPFTKLEPAILPPTEATNSLYPHLAGQVLSFLAVLIETEYRVFDGDLLPVWSLLLRAAEIGAEGPARGVPGEGRTAPPDVGEWLAGKAVKMGSRLLEIYSDLRQVRGQHFVFEVWVQGIAVVA
jgi:hypothetical protein